MDVWPLVLAAMLEGHLAWTVVEGATFAARMEGRAQDKVAKAAKAVAKPSASKGREKGKGSKDHGKEKRGKNSDRSPRLRRSWWW